MFTHFLMEKIINIVKGTFGLLTVNRLEYCLIKFCAYCSGEYSLLLGYKSGIK